MSEISEIQVTRFGRLSSFKLWTVCSIMLLFSVVATSCFHERMTRGLPRASSISRPYPTVNFDLMWETSLNLLRDYEKNKIDGKQLRIYTRDTRGRFVVLITTRRGILRRHREKLEIGLFPGETQGTLVVVETTPEVYEVALTAPPEWMPSRREPNVSYAQRFIEDLTSKLAQTVAPNG